LRKQIPKTYHVLYFVYWLVARTSLRLLTRWHIEGTEHVPKKGACILVSNHLTWLDPPLVYSGLKRGLYGLAAAKYRNKRILKLTFKLGRAVFVRRGEFDRDALRLCFAILEGGNALYASAEGTRSPTGALTKGKAGIAYLATRANVPIVPVALWGGENVVEDLKRFKRADVTTRFGAPFRLPEGRARGEELEQYTDEIMCTIAAMLPETYRGVYADHPRTLEKLNAASN
jgi:1-acyl-sn-glycerol-3-phosphate acyltransferase